MGGQRRYTDLPLLDELNAMQLGDEAAQPDTVSAGNTDKVTKRGGNFLPWKSIGKPVEVVKPLLAGFLLFLVSGALCRIWWSSHKLSDHKSSSYNLGSYGERKWLSLDDGSIQKYLDDFNNAADEMKLAWESSGLAVRQAFQKHFSPSYKDGQKILEDPLEIISDHVAKMRECEVPPDSSVEARRGFAQHLHLLRSTCRTVKLRLDELKEFADVSQDLGAPVPFPVQDKPCSYLGLDDAGSGMGFGMRATDFLASLELVGGESTQAVDDAVAKELILLLFIEKKHSIYNLVIRYYFESFLQPCGENHAVHAACSTAKYRIPYTGRAVHTEALAQAAAHVFSESDSTLNYTSVRKAHQIADNWTPKRVLKAMKQQEKENANIFQKRLNNRRNQMRSLLRQGIPSDDLKGASPNGIENKSSPFGLMTIRSVELKQNVVQMKLNSL